MIAKVTAGTPFVDALKAETWNSFVDAAIDFKKRGGLRDKRISAGVEYPATTVLVKNTTGSALDPLSIVAPTVPIVTPTDNLDEFKTRSGWVVVTPETTHFGTFFVTAESIPEDEIGLAYCDGVVPAMINVPQSFFTRADICGTDVTRLESCLNGSSQILWKESGTGLKWCAIRFGVPNDVSGVGITNATVAINTAGIVSVWQNGSDTGYDLPNVYLDWAHGEQQISSGKKVMFKWFSAERRWRFTHADCET